MIVEWMYEEPHPGALLAKRFVEPLGLSAAQLAEGLRVPVERVQALLRGEARIDLSLARRLSGLFKVRAGFWLGVQAHYDAHTLPVEEADYVAPLPLDGFVVGVGGVVALDGESPSRDATAWYVPPEERIGEWPERTP